MKYIVNTMHLNVESAAAIVRALEHHYGERCIDRVCERLDEGGFVIDLVDSPEDTGYPDWLAKVE